MSAGDLKELSIQDQTHLQQDDQGRLYWRGRRIKTAGWTITETAAVISVVIAGLAALLVFLAEYEAILRGLDSILGGGTESAN